MRALIVIYFSSYVWGSSSRAVVSACELTLDSHSNVADFDVCNYWTLILFNWHFNTELYRKTKLLRWNVSLSLLLTLCNLDHDTIYTKDTNKFISMLRCATLMMIENDDAIINCKAQKCTFHINLFIEFNAPYWFWSFRLFIFWLTSCVDSMLFDHQKIIITKKKNKNQTTKWETIAYTAALFHEYACFC